MAEDEDFAEMFEAQMRDTKPVQKTKAGQTVRGTVVAISDDVVFVDIGTRREAQLPRTAVLDAQRNVTLAVGDEISATVAKPEGRAAAELKMSLGGEGTDVAELEVAAQSGAPVEGEFTKAVKAGIEVDIGGRRAFCPASQVDLTYVSDLETFVGQKHFFKVLEVREGGRSIIVSRKALLEDERNRQAGELLERLHEGDEIEGIVQTIQPYGAFIDIGGIQGLVHVSEIAHTRVTSPSDVLSVGESVRVRVQSIQAQPSGPPRISLSMKAMVQPPQGGAAAELEIITATVSKIENYGVLVETPGGSGLVPTAELALPPGSDPRRAFQPGDTFEVVLQRKDPSGKLRFSARAVEKVEEQKAYRAFTKGKGEKSDKLGSLGDLMKGLDLGGKK